MKGLLLAAVAAIGLSSGTSALAADAVMLTASSGGAYNTKICPAIANHVAAQGISLKCTPSQGSGENFAAIQNGKVPLALGQTDVAGLELIKQKEQNGGKDDESFGTVGFLAAEGLFCVAKKGGRIPTENAWSVLNDSESPREKFVISTYGENSGTAGTLAYIGKNFKNFGTNVHIKYLPNLKFDVELGRLRSGSRDMVCFVNMPNPDDERFKAVVNSDDLFFVPFDSPMLATLQINGRPAYQIMEAPLTGGWSAFLGTGKTVKTIHTGTTVYMNVDTIPEPLYKAVIAAIRDPKLLESDDYLSKMTAWKNKALGTMGEAYNSVRGHS